MKYLKKYKVFESNEIPDNFIRLDSIGHVLDPETGESYALLKKGGYDKDNGYDIMGGDYDYLSDDDREIVDSLIKSSEDLKEKIDFSFIDDIQDILVNIIDTGGRIEVEVEVGTVLVYDMYVSGVDKHETYYDLFPLYYRMVSESDDVIYTLRVNYTGLDHTKVVSVTELIVFLESNGWDIDNTIYLQNHTGDQSIDLPTSEITSRLTNELIPRFDHIEKMIGDRIGGGFFIIIKKK